MSDTEAGILEKMLDALNTAYAADPAAMNALCNLRVPCNAALADHPNIVVRPTGLGDGCEVGLLGVLAGITEAAGLPKIAGKFDFDLKDKHRLVLKGFTKYEVPLAEKATHQAQ